MNLRQIVEYANEIQEESFLEGVYYVAEEVKEYIKNLEEKALNPSEAKEQIYEMIDELLSEYEE